MPDVFCFETDFSRFESRKGTGYFPPLNYYEFFKNEGHFMNKKFAGRMTLIYNITKFVSTMAKIWVIQKIYGGSDEF